MSIHLEKKTTVRIPCCAVYHLFPTSERCGYSSGSLGWNCDIFDLPVLQVRTGYRARGKAIPRELYEDLEESAKRASSATLSELRLEFQARVIDFLFK